MSQQLPLLHAVPKRSVIDVWKRAASASLVSLLTFYVIALAVPGDQGIVIGAICGILVGTAVVDV